MIQNQLLTGLTALITRPRGQGQSIVDAIAGAGGKSVQFPLMEINPVSSDESVIELRKQVQNLDRYDLLIFISTNAVKFGFQWIDRYWPQFPAQLEVFAVGPTTAAALTGLPCTVHSPSTGMQSEDLLALPQLQQVQGNKIALFRGRGGRELLADTLRERGAQVDTIETYERSMLVPETGELLNSISENGVNVICVTSMQILDSLCHLVDIKKDGIGLLPLLVPSERIRDNARTAGFVNVYCSYGASDEAILSELKEIAGYLSS
ncbi:MAG: uroporphyrinogen-III synthase [Gammaproteobacteria bacterium]|nr:uroporphyrinogen-III synthase [Gammaproteobacteria bacterium]